LVNNHIIRAHRRTAKRKVVVAVNRKFTRIPKVQDLLLTGVPTEVIPTYCALADHANNKSGLCWPKMERLAAILNRSVRTIQRHLHLLREKGLIKFVERRRYKGRFSSYLYKICFLATTGHEKPVGSSDPNKRRTRLSRTPPKSPTKSVTEGYEWLFGDSAPKEKQQAHDRKEKRKREEEAKRRSEGYEWFFS
jgi:DNA-binding transcriptional ArsR family regulator